MHWQMRRKAFIVDYREIKNEWAYMKAERAQYKQKVIIFKDYATAIDIVLWL